MCNLKLGSSRKYSIRLLSLIIQVIFPIRITEKGEKVWRYGKY